LLIKALRFNSSSDKSKLASQLFYKQSVNRLYLSAVKVNNFKSLESTEITDIGSIDIIAGKNNSGKSSILEAINIATQSTISQNFQTQLASKYFSGEDIKRAVAISLIFDIKEETRQSWVGSLTENKQIMQKVLETAFMKKVEFYFGLISPQGQQNPSNQFGLMTIRCMGTDGLFGDIMTRRSIEQFELARLKPNLEQNGDLTSQGITSIGKFVIPSNTVFSNSKSDVFFIILALQDWARQIYYFSAFRQSAIELEAKTTPNLENNGNNLVQRLFTIKQNEDQNWKSIQKFVERTLPDLGTLQSRVNNNRTTKTVFVDKKWGIEIDIHDMGSGIEQLVMIACVLISKVQGSLIMIESPEHHLHPGAQRVLLEFLRQNLKKNQILMTTHSPVFLGQKDIALHLVTKSIDGTKVQKVEDLYDLSLALSELGSKNSDLLLADIALFVEGESDEGILKTWANKLGIDFESNNVLCLHIHGCRNLNYYVNSEVLDRISKLKMPYYFIIDSDEKSLETISKIKSQITNLFILERREIENYLLNATWILEALKIKAKDANCQASLEKVQPSDIAQQIRKHAKELRNLVLMKRIKTEIGGGTFLSDDTFNRLIKETEGSDAQTIIEKVCDSINSTMKEKCSKEKITDIVNKQYIELNEAWEKGQEEIIKIAPGEEILTATFQEYGLKYNKLKDGQRIAQQAKDDEIPSEIVNIMGKLGLKTKE